MVEGGLSSGKCVLVIDLGTGGPKVGLVDQEGCVITSTSAPYNCSSCQMVEQNTIPQSGGPASQPA